MKILSTVIELSQSLAATGCNLKTGYLSSGDSDGWGTSSRRADARTLLPRGLVGGAALAAFVIGGTASMGPVRAARRRGHAAARNHGHLYRHDHQPERP